MLIEVTETNPAPAGRKMAHVKAKDGQEFEIGPEKLAVVRIGMRYDVETQDREWNGRTIRKITKATPAGTAPSAAFARQTAPAASLAVAGTSGEAEFVGRVLAALILKGEVVNTKKGLADATLMLRGLWKYAEFGNEQAFKEAAE